MLEYISIQSIPIFLLIFARVIAFFVTMPLFSYRTIPTSYKIGLAFFIALIFFPTYDHSSVHFEQLYLLLLLKEVMVGLLIGLIAYMIVSAVQIAGGFIDFQMGFAIANVIDPQTGAQSPIMGQYFYMIALLFLLAVDGHHLLIDGIHYSFQLIPLDGFMSVQENGLASFTIQVFNQLFLTAFQMAIPIVGCLFLVDVALGIVARTVPQLNVFVVGLPIKIFVSFVVVLFFLPIYIILVRVLFSNMFTVMRDLMYIFGGA